MKREAFVLTELALVLTLQSGPARADYQETKVATQFQLYVPPNNDTGTRYSAVVVTAMSGTAAEPCVINLIDDSADGDSDDTVMGSSLNRGASLVRYIRDGSVNDDAGGKWDGDYFRIEATQPVAVYMATDSDWQHDWAPASNGTLRGTQFFLFANGYSVSKRDIDAFAYENGTRVELYDVSASALAGSGVSAPGPRPSSPLLSVDLDEGEDLLVRHGLGRDLLDKGRTYEVVASKPVTILFGAISSITPQNQARDGGGFVPGRSGRALDDDFYFHVPTNPAALSEQEVRIVSSADNVVATLYGWNSTRAAFEQIRAYALGRMDHADYVGGTYQLYRLRSSGGKVVIFEANWMETGSAGTSDEASFAPGLFAADGSQEFLVYMGPPGRQTNTSSAGTWAHLYLFSQSGQSRVSIVDADTGGNLLRRTVDIPPRGFADVALDVTQYGSLNRTAQGIRPYVRVASASPLSVAMSNWNDNWMAYATATVVRNPQVTLSASPVAQIGQTIAVTGSISEADITALTGLNVDIQLGSGLEYVSGTLDGQREAAVRASPAGTVVTFEAAGLTRGASLPLQMTARVTPAAGSAGEVLSVQAVASADQGTTLVASTDSAPTLIVSSTLASLSDLTGSAGDRVARLSWVVTGVSGTTQMQVERSAQATTGYTVLGGSARSVTGESTSLMSLDDTTVANSASYYYRVRAQNASGETTYAGPVLIQPVDLRAPAAPGLTLLPRDRAASVLLSAPSDVDTVGCRVYRRPAGTSSWTNLNVSYVACSGFSDSGLQNGVAYEYYAQAVDDDGNWSVGSAIRSVTPMSPPSRSSDVVVSYEDMIGQGSNDWDYNDFIVRIQVGETLSNGNLVRLTLDYEPLARGAGYVQQFIQRIPLRGAYTATLVTYAASGAVVSSEALSGTGTMNVVIFKETIQALPAVVRNYANTDRTQGSPSVGRSAQLVIDVVPALNPDGSYGRAPFDPYLMMPYLPSPNAVHLPELGGPRELSSRLEEIAGFSLDFAIVTDPSDLSWSFEGEPVWRGYPSHTAWVKQGNPVDWHTRPRSVSDVWHKPR